MFEFRMFDDPPSDGEIAQFVDANYSSLTFHNQGCEGFTLWRSGQDYLYIWLVSMVDMDINYHYLFEVRETISVPGNNETRHYLYVGVGGDFHDGFEFESATKDSLTFFGPTVEETRGFLHRQLHWFADLVVKYEYSREIENGT